MCVYIYIAYIYINYIQYFCERVCVYIYILHIYILIIYNISVNVYVCIYIYIAYIYINLYNISVNVYVCIYIYCIYIYILIIYNISVNVYVCIYIYIAYIYTYTYIYIYWWSSIAARCLFHPAMPCPVQELCLLGRHEVPREALWDQGDGIEVKTVIVMGLLINQGFTESYLIYLFSI